MRLKEKVALVTGGAHGMGAAEAKLFAKEGARVVVADVRDGDGKAVIDQITSAGGQARFVHLDVTREAEWQQAVAFAVSTFGKLEGQRVITTVRGKVGHRLQGHGLDLRTNLSPNSSCLFGRVRRALIF